MNWLSRLGLKTSRITWNPSVAELYEEAVSLEQDGAIVSSGALAVMSGEKTGRSPKDRRIVSDPESSGDIWWGQVNRPASDQVFATNRERVIDYFNTRDQLYVVDGFAGWEADYRLRVRVVCERPYHALFMRNMLVPPTSAQLGDFGAADLTIFNAGRFPANSHTEGMTSKTSILLSLERGELTILGTEYAGEMKKGLFSFANYLVPKRGSLSMHCSATEGRAGETSLLFGLSGTGKTTLSADPKRRLIGDDEHVWSENGIFNLEGGCYAKVIHLSPDAEPQIHQAIRFGTVLENVVYDPQSREVDFDDDSITTNTRASYPLEFIANSKRPAIGPHPSHVIFLTCDAFGVLPPVSRLTVPQALYHFMNGYTAKIPGTEVGVVEPGATFSPCFGAPFLVWHPRVYAELLAGKIREHQTRAWLVNTGWTGGPFGEGHRIALQHTRRIIDAIHEGTLEDVSFGKEPVFGLAVPVECPGVPSEILWPRGCWKNQAAYDKKASQLARRFVENFEPMAPFVSEEVRLAGPEP